jgi:microcompartment protein CcmK/EutM
VQVLSIIGATVDFVVLLVLRTSVRRMHNMLYVAVKKMVLIAIVDSERKQSDR